jgi:hypothetical protein
MAGRAAHWPAFCNRLPLPFARLLLCGAIVRCGLVLLCAVVWRRVADAVASAFDSCAGRILSPTPMLPCPPRFDYASQYR